MSTTVIVLLIVVGIVAFVLIAISLGLPVIGGKQSMRSSMTGSVRAIVDSQRQASMAQKGSSRRQVSLMDTAQEGGKVVAKTAIDSRLTLRKKLKYSQWKMSPGVFYSLELAISIVSFLVVSYFFNFILIRLIALLTGHLFMGWLINSAVYKRFKGFDKDYPSFLLSLVGLLKTGMNVIQALQAAAEGLEPESLARLEVETMLERLKLGVPEDQSIGAFGEDIYHEEIELFVQALLLARKVGGNLSDTLDRLAKQVRKRQYFRESANAAISQQRLSIVVILVILFGIMAYMTVVAPDLVMGAVRDEFGWQAIQFCFVVIMLGIFWIRQVTKIRT